MVARSLIYLGTALIAVFAIYNLYSVLGSDSVTTQELFGALAMLGLLLVMVGTALRQARA